MNPRRSYWCPYLILVAALLTIGCNGESARISEAQGIVKLHNKPVPNAEIMFLPEDSSKGPSSSAITDADGHFTLKTEDGRDGAVVGKHRVTVRTSKPRNDPRPEDNPHAGSMTGDMPSYVPVSEVYGKVNAQNPIGVIEVITDQHTYDLNLK
jgi:hypothetical protein